MDVQTKKAPPQAVFALFAVLALNVLLWMGSSYIRARWPGVPPVPQKESALAMTLGDGQFFYRFGAITLQNIGDTGGRITPLKEYDYTVLNDWFWLLNGLDARSDHIPLIAAFYFGATRVPKDVAEVVDYLSVIGDSPVGEKWRWLAHAVFLVRHRMNDVELGLELAHRLAAIDNPDMPIWARQMPAFVHAELGEKDAARAIIAGLLKTEGKRLHPNEINFMYAYLTEQLGISEEEAAAAAEEARRRQKELEEQEKSGGEDDAAAQENDAQQSP